MTDHTPSAASVQHQGDVEALRDGPAYKETAATTPPRMAYVSRIKDCGCVVAATVDEPDRARETAQFVAKEVREGFNVERMLVEDARALPWGWPCEHMKLTKAGVAEGQEVLDV